MPNIKELIELEESRQANELSLIASENYISSNVKNALASSLSNKYSEGYPGKRYYAGNKIIDQIEIYTQELAAKVFETDYKVNVQALSGSPANLAVYNALLSPGDTILAMSLEHGGHLTHGHSVNITGKLYNFVHYDVSSEDELINYDQVMELAKQAKPKLIVAGATAYPAYIDFGAFARIARVTGAKLMVDMSHIAGLVAGKVHPSPFHHADVVTTTTHKTLRGPRGALIFSKDEYSAAIDRSIFPGLQGGPHMNNIAGIAACLEEAQSASFGLYARQVINNARALAFGLQSRGLRLVADGTETHLILVDLNSVNCKGKEAQERLEKVGLITNKNTIPFEKGVPDNPSGLRLGTAAVTTRGMKESDMDKLANLIVNVLTTAKMNPRFEDEMLVVKTEVSKMAAHFRLPR